MSGMRWKSHGLAILAIAAATGSGMWLVPAGRWVVLAAGTVLACAILALGIIRPAREWQPQESDLVEQLDPDRHNELIRGTSLHLREMRYRYSVRSDRTDSSSRRPFTTEVNTIRLGFLPVILTDNDTDYQGYGYLAFVYDGRRWRGPGLPCPNGRDAATAHAKRHVAPVGQT
jgi:hypothetical protein